jgi:anaerobic selenocysteine-containing dehydrogenase
MATKETRPWTWTEGNLVATKTCRWSAPGCHDGCGVVYYTKDGKLVKVEGDKDSPVYQGRLCPRCLSLPEAVSDTKRVIYPMKRTGPRGSNEFERISWDEAYKIIVDQVHKIQKEDGAESIVTMVGTGRNIWGIVPYLTFAAFGSPNFAMGFLAGDSCYLPRAAIMGAIQGDFTIVDCAQQFEDKYKNPRWKKPECIIFWGNNALVSNPDGFMGHWIVDCMKMGTKLIVVDPIATWVGTRAEYHLQLRPGTDAAVGLAMLHVIINEKLYDKEFVENWTLNFEELTAHVQKYTPEMAAEISWVPAQTIIDAARFYAKSKPAAIQWGLAVDTQIAGVDVAWIICILRAITGNIDVPGGDIMVRGAYDAPIATAASVWGFHDLPREMQEKRLGVEKFPLFKMGFAATSNGDCVLEACESGRPYPVKMLWLQTTNPITNTASESKRVLAGMQKVPFIVNVDPVLTPTSVAVCDLLLPACESPERDSLRSWWTPLRTISKVCQPPGEAKTDEEIVLEIGKLLNPKKFPWKDVKDLLSWCIRKCGLTFDQLEKQVYIFPEFEYEKYKKGLLREDQQPGFNTESGKFECQANLFAEWNLGLDILPEHREPVDSPVSTPDLFREYPLVYTAGARQIMYFHSENRQQKTNREFAPWPLMKINPIDAEKLGIQDGDWVWIENMRGRIKEKAKVTPTILEGVVHAEHGWWYPEKDPVLTKDTENRLHSGPNGPSGLFASFDTNANVLTSMCTSGPTGYGSPLKNTICKVYKAEGGL